MNTADRSLAIVDYALRRRFRFISIKPEFNEAFINFLEGKGISKENAELVVSKVKAANEVISSMDRGLEIGHSYFCQTEGCEDFPPGGKIFASMSFSRIFMKSASMMRISMN